MLSHHLIKPHVGTFYWTDRGYIALCLQDDPRNPMFSVFKPENTAECVWEMYTELPTYSMFGKLEKFMPYPEVAGWVEVLQQDLYGRATKPLMDQLQMQHSLPHGASPTNPNFIKPLAGGMQPNGAYNAMVNVEITVSVGDTPNKPMWQKMSDYWEDRGFGDD